MKLARLGHAAFEKEMDRSHNELDTLTKKIVFANFGRGEEKTSDFHLTIDWDDIENMIADFAIMGHPGATALKRAQDLAKAAMTAGWSAASPR